MLYNAKELKIRIRDADINYITFGKGKKALVMIQGLNTRGIKGSSLPLAFMYRCFVKDYTVYLFDRRPDITDNTTVRDFAEDIAFAMDTLGIKNADILGVSQGGMIAQYLAIDRPDLINKMVLAFTLSKNNETVNNVIKRWVEMAQAKEMKNLICDMAQKMYSDSYFKRYKLFMPLLTVMQKPKDVPRFVKMARSCLTCNTYDELKKIKCSVLVIGAMQDKIVSGEASLEIASKLGCRLHMYEDLGHAAYEEARDFNKIVYDFLSQGAYDEQRNIYTS